MIHIVGTNHELQHTGTPRRLANMVPFTVAVKTANKARENLKAYLRQLAGDITPAVIAEELSQDALPADAASNVKAVADELCIEHRFCDPGFEERAKLGLPWHGTEGCDPSERAKFDAIREAFWLGALADVLDREILFVCGADHVTSPNRLLGKRGIDVSVHMEYFGKEVYDHH